MPDTFVLMIGTYASGTPYVVIVHACSSRGARDHHTHRDFCHTLHLLEHMLEDVEEVFALHMLRHHAQRVDIGAGPMNAELIRAECVYLSASSVCSDF